MVVVFQHFIFRRNNPTIQRTIEEEFEDTKGVIRIRKSRKDRQHNGQKDKQQSTKHTYKTKDRVTRTPLKQTMIYKTYI